MRSGTQKYLLSKLPEIQRLAAAGVERGVICARLHCSRPTLRAFLKQQGVVLSNASVPPVRKPPSGSWIHMVANAEGPSPFTHAELKVRGMDAHSAEELEAIHARLLTRLAQSKRVRRRVMTDQVYPW